MVRVLTTGDGWRPRAIAFDAFGTLVGIRDRRRPYHRFSRLARRTPGAIDPLVADIPMRDWALSVGAAPEDLIEAEADLAAEVGSVAMRDWVPPAWTGIRAAGLGIAVCSNLAGPYGPPLLAALPDRPDPLVLSYAVRLRKPDPAIYGLVAEGLGLPAADILFVGDTPLADYHGPIAAGMKAMPVAEFERDWPSLI